MLAGKKVPMGDKIKAAVLKAKAKDLKKEAKKAKKKSVPTKPPTSKEARAAVKKNLDKLAGVLKKNSPKKTVLKWEAKASKEDVKELAKTEARVNTKVDAIKAKLKKLSGPNAPQGAKQAAAALKKALKKEKARKDLIKQEEKKKEVKAKKLDSKAKGVKTKAEKLKDKAKKVEKDLKKVEDKAKKAKKEGKKASIGDKIKAAVLKAKAKDATQKLKKEVKKEKKKKKEEKKKEKKKGEEQKKKKEQEKAVKNAKSTAKDLKAKAKELKADAPGNKTKAEAKTMKKLKDKVKKAKKDLKKEEKKEIKAKIEGKKVPTDVKIKEAVLKAKVKSAKKAMKKEKVKEKTDAKIKAAVKKAVKKAAKPTDPKKQSKKETNAEKKDAKIKAAVKKALKKAAKPTDAKKQSKKETNAEKKDAKIKAAVKKAVKKAAKPTDPKKQPKKETKAEKKGAAAVPKAVKDAADKVKKLEAQKDGIAKKLAGTSPEAAKLVTHLKKLQNEQNDAHKKITDQAMGVTTAGGKAGGLEAHSSWEVKRKVAAAQEAEEVITTLSGKSPPPSVKTAVHKIDKVLEDIPEGSFDGKTVMKKVRGPIRTLADAEANTLIRGMVDPAEADKRRLVSLAESIAGKFEKRDAKGLAKIASELGTKGRSAGEMAIAMHRGARLIRKLAAEKAGEVLMKLDEVGKQNAYMLIRGLEGRSPTEETKQIAKKASKQIGSLFRKKHEAAKAHTHISPHNRKAAIASIQATIEDLAERKARQVLRSLVEDSRWRKPSTATMKNTAEGIDSIAGRHPTRAEKKDKKSAEKAIEQLKENIVEDKDEAPAIKNAVQAVRMLAQKKASDVVKKVMHAGSSALNTRQAMERLRKTVKRILKVQEISKQVVDACSSTKPTTKPTSKTKKSAALFEDVEWAPTYSSLAKQALTPGNIHSFNVATKGICVRTRTADGCHPNSEGCEPGAVATSRCTKQPVAKITSKGLRKTISFHGWVPKGNNSCSGSHSCTVAHLETVSKKRRACGAFDVSWKARSHEVTLVLKKAGKIVAKEVHRSRGGSEGAYTSSRLQIGHAMGDGKYSVDVYLGGYGWHGEHDKLGRAKVRGKISVKPIQFIPFVINPNVGCFPASEVSESQVEYYDDKNYDTAKVGELPWTAVFLQLNNARIDAYNEAMSGVCVHTLEADGCSPDENGCEPGADARSNCVAQPVASLGSLGTVSSRQTIDFSGHLRASTHQAGCKGANSCAGSLMESSHHYLKDCGFFTANWRAAHEIEPSGVPAWYQVGIVVKRDGKILKNVVHRAKAMGHNSSWRFDVTRKMGAGYYSVDFYTSSFAHSGERRAEAKVSVEPIKFSNLDNNSRICQAEAKIALEEERLERESKLPAAPIKENGVYQARSNGPDCSTFRIEDPEICQKAAKELGFKTKPVVIVKLNTAPKGCFLGHPGDNFSHAFYNEMDGKTGNMLYKSVCFCEAPRGGESVRKKIRKRWRTVRDMANKLKEQVEQVSAKAKYLKVRTKRKYHAIKLKKDPKKTDPSKKGPEKKKKGKTKAALFANRSRKTRRRGHQRKGRL
eukprot:TRINITY_DN472_c1_g1_i2.p1 TRINITY_DN472_c1_g1~~TRINITY_DN472_c1_g1_i2.p1  ORF type:complete len:1744 (-),score=499.76 TRINITY_DN472_c1_g1_i2:105-4769(-)